MRLLSCACGLAVLSCAAFSPIPAALAQASDCKDQLPLARQAIHWSQDQLSKFDTAIASMDAAKRQGLR